MADVLEKVKRAFGFGDDYEYEDYEDEELYEDIPEEEEKPAVQPTRSIRTRRPSGNQNVVNLHTDTNLVITVHEPLSYDESPLIVDDLKAQKAVVLNFEQLDIDVKREIFDFVNGALYAIEGKIQKVNKDIFILAPPTVEIDGLKEELQNSGIFPW
ncbi:MAG: cell division protein SepF [Tissierellia bacterium]|nr:cell division protein SepF [Tissierellia bacterium]